MQTASTTVVDLQLATSTPGLPGEEDFTRWADAALAEAGHEGAADITVRIVDADESQELNSDYRNKDKPTNVLSFPSEIPDFVLAEMDSAPLGDLVICAPVVAAEAVEQGKAERDHWAHLTVHGVLHLLGHDHIEDDEAEAMEAMEVRALAALGIANPYE